MKIMKFTGSALLLGSLLSGCSDAASDAGAVGGAAGNGAGGSGAEWTAGAPGRTKTPAEWPEQEGLGSAEGDPPASGSLYEIEECNAQNPNKLERLIDFVPADTNARGSAVLAREALEASRAPVPYHLRTHELLGHYAPALPTSDTATPLVQLRDHGQVNGSYELLVAIQIPPLAQNTRPPVALTVVIDTTLSMQSVLERARSSLRALGEGLRSGDQLRWLTSDVDAAPVDLAIEGPSDPALETLVSDLSATVAEQPASLSELVTRGIAGARDQLVAESWNRVIVITDGEGDLDEDTHATLKEASLADGILTMAVGVGVAFEHSPRSLRLISHAGRGPWIQVDGDAAATALRDRFSEHFGIAYEDVHVHVSVPWYFEIARPYAFETTAPDAAPAQYFAPGQTAVFPFRLTACSAQALVGSDVIEAMFQWTNPATGVSESVSLSRPIEELLDHTKPANVAPLRHVFAVLAYAEALRALDKPRLELARATVDSAQNLDPNPQLSEIMNLIDQHPLLLP